MTAAVIQYREAVSAEMQRVYGISWQDASGDSEPLERAQVAGQSPVDFVDWWGRKYHLIPKTEW